MLRIVYEKHDKRLDNGELRSATFIARTFNHALFKHAFYDIMIRL